jgi:hypothetical protein
MPRTTSRAFRRPGGQSAPTASWPMSNATRSIRCVQRAFSRLAASFNEVGNPDFPGGVCFLQRRTRRYVIKTPIPAEEAVAGRKVAIREVRFGWANARRHQHQNCYRSKAKKRAHRFARPPMDLGMTAWRFGRFNQISSRRVTGVTRRMRKNSKNTTTF